MASPTRRSSGGRRQSRSACKPRIGNGIGDAFCDFLLKSRDVGDAFVDDHLAAIVQRHGPDWGTAAAVRKDRMDGRNRKREDDRRTANLFDL